MMEIAQPARPLRRNVLVASHHQHDCGWYGELDGLLAPRWVSLVQTRRRRETVATLERGFVDLAVVASREGTEGLTTLEVIRSVRGDLPCVLVTAEATSGVLQRALALDAWSVVPAPVDSKRLADMLLSLLALGSHGS